MKNRFILTLALPFLFCPANSPGQSPSIGRSDVSADIAFNGKVLFLGDSITHAGHYVSLIDTAFWENGNSHLPEFINLGLPSETVTGLSEPAHPWPRPNVHERLERALQKIEPDLVFACYGMNDGIYYPFSEDRFSKYQKGIGLLIEKVKKSGANLVLMTPPPFDPQPLRAKGKLKPAGEKEYSWTAIYENYDSEVIAKYGKWIIDQRKRVDGVIDLRPAVLEYTAEKRRSNPKFTLSNDGVHLNAEGHGIMAKTILSAMGLDSRAIDLLPPERVAEEYRRHQILHGAWLSHVGHTRPGMRPGLPLATAKIVAAAFPESEKPVSLFNGVDLKNWDGDAKIWSVEDGLIVGRNQEPVASSTYLFTRKNYRNFRLIFDVKQTVSPKHSKMHSAVAVLGERFEDKGGNAHGFRGPLLMFCHDWGIWDAYRRNRIEPAGQKGALRIPAEKIGDWNRCEVLAIGNRIRFAANGELVFDFTGTPEMLQPSPIGLQIHSNKSPQEYKFRGIVLSESPQDQLVTLSVEEAPKRDSKTANTLIPPSPWSSPDPLGVGVSLNVDF